MADENKTFWVEAIPYNHAINKGDVVGYLGHRRIKVGERFQVTEQQFSKNWMQRVSGKKAKEADEEQADVQADTRRKRQHEPVI